MTALLLAPANAFAFDRFLLIPAQNLLLENQEAVRIGQRAFDVLTVLVAAHGQIVAKRTLLARVWPGLVVEEGNLKVNIAALRRVLGDADAGAPRFIATVVGRGYRFIAPVRLATRTSADPGNLPQVAWRIYGRETVIDAIVRDLDGTRLVTIAGPGGVGKTTVALAAAHKAGGAFGDGCRRIDVSLMTEPQEVSDALAGLGSVAEGAERPSMLIVLDNCEHLIGAVALGVDRLLATTWNVKCIVTSREPLCIRGERVRRLAGLALPPEADGITAADAAAFPAVQLFVERAMLACQAFTLDDANAAAVGAICRRLDGLALAIERVAARAGALGIAATLDHLKLRFDMFDGFHAGPARHRTLTATVYASYVLLTPGEQATLRCLAVLDGPFTLDAACAVCGGQDSERATVLEAMASLVAKSLLVAEPGHGGMTYRQMHVVRAFALDQLRERGELKGLHEVMFIRWCGRPYGLAMAAGTTCRPWQRAWSAATP